MHKVLVLKADAVLPGGFKFPKGTEFETLNKVVYMQGMPVAMNAQMVLLNWIEDNPGLFSDDTRR